MHLKLKNIIKHHFYQSAFILIGYSDESSRSEQNDSFWLLPSITQGQKQKSLSCKINETGRTGDNYKSIMKKRRRESQRSLDSDDDDDFASGTKFRKDLNRKKPACRKNGISRNPFGREINFKKTKYRKGFDQLLSINEPFSSSSEGFLKFFFFYKFIFGIFFVFFFIRYY